MLPGQSDENTRDQDRSVPAEPGKLPMGYSSRLQEMRDSIPSGENVSEDSIRPLWSYISYTRG